MTQPQQYPGQPTPYPGPPAQYGQPEYPSQPQPPYGPPQFTPPAPYPAAPNQSGYTPGGGHVAPYPVGSYPANSYPGNGYPAATPPPGRLLPLNGWLLLGAAVIVAVGSLMPWATALGGAISKAGTDGDGALTIILAIAAGVFAVLTGVGIGRTWMMIVAIVCGVLTLAIALYDIVDVGSEETGTISVGSGLWVTLIGGIAVVGIAIIGLVKRA